MAQALTSSTVLTGKEIILLVGGIPTVYAAGATILLAPMDAQAFKNAGIVSIP
jgi:hypothetical protein